MQISVVHRTRKTVSEDTGASNASAGTSFASSAPFRNYKRNMANGGAMAPLIAHWPSVIGSGGTATDQPGHIIDIMATLMEVSGGTWPAAHAGEALMPLPGKSLQPIFAGKQREPHDALYFHLMDHRAVIAGDWKLVSDWNRPWELYNLATDRTELQDRAADEPARLGELTRLWEAWWATKDPDLFETGDTEPSYRHLHDETRNTQGAGRRR